MKKDNVLSFLTNGSKVTFRNSISLKKDGNGIHEEILSTETSMDVKDYEKVAKIRLQCAAY